MPNEKDQFTSYREARQKGRELRNLAVLYRVMNREEVAADLEQAVESLERQGNGGRPNKHN